MKNRSQFKPVSLLSIVRWVLIYTGAMALITSVIINSSVLAFVGLGLVFWGAILLYLKPEPYVKETLLGTTALPANENLNQIIKALGYKGKGIYLPPRYLESVESSKVYVSARQDVILPHPEQIQSQEDKLFLKNPEGILITPPGAELIELFEEKMGKSFTIVDVQNLEQNMNRLLIEDLEIAKNVEITKENNRINIKMEKTIYKNMHKGQPRELFNPLGCPLCSAIACALTKTTGKPIIIEKEEINKSDQTLDIEYRLLE